MGKRQQELPTSEDEFEDIFEDEEIIFDPSLLEGCSSDDNMEEIKARACRLDSIVNLSDLKIDDEKNTLKAYLPSMGMGENHQLEVNHAAYDFFTQVNVEWPCLSFDILSSGTTSNSMISISMIAGSQADKSSKNKLYLINTSNMKLKTKKMPNEPGFISSDESSSEDEQKTPVLGRESPQSLSYVSISHPGCVNRLRLSKAKGIPPFIATWSENGKVYIWNADEISQLERHDNKNFAKKKNKLPENNIEPICLLNNPIEGFALAWSNVGIPGRLLVGDCHGKILLSEIVENSIAVRREFISSENSSIEDLVWSTIETDIFSSCDTQGMIKIWDCRQKGNKPIAIWKASSRDVNVISWNPVSTFLLASGHDDGEWALWDMRAISSNALNPVISFNWHTNAITSIEWHPTDPSMITVSGSDDQLTIWDLSMKDASDGEEEDIPSQLLFIHQGQMDMKEAHWITNPHGGIISTSGSGFHIFKPFNI